MAAKGRIGGVSACCGRAGGRMRGLEELDLQGTTVPLVAAPIGAGCASMSRTRSILNRRLVRMIHNQHADWTLAGFEL
jgi:hypothetical protein